MYYLFCASILVTVCHGWSLSSISNDDVSEHCYDAMESCAFKHLTRGKCKSTFSAFQLDWVRNDVDNNCKVNASDLIPDVEHFYDINGDGQLCGEEWTNRRTSYFGYSRELTVMEWQAVGQGADCLPVAVLNNVPSRDLKTQFSSDGVQRLVNFCNQGNNQQTNRDCVGLLTLCREGRPDLTSCQGYSTNQQTLNEKFNAVMRSVDANQDGTIFSQEIVNDLFTNYDSNFDSCISEAELTQRWANLFSLSSPLAKMVHNYLDADNNDCMLAAEVTAVWPASGLPTSEWGNILMTDMTHACEEQNLWDTNLDCMQVVDTCRLHYKNNHKCKEVLGDCGLKGYKHCIKTLTYPFSECAWRAADRKEADMEQRRVQNQLMPSCTAYTQEDIDKCWSFQNAKRQFLKLFGY